MRARWKRKLTCRIDDRRLLFLLVIEVDRETMPLLLNFDFLSA